MSDTTRQTLKKPHMAHGSCQGNMSETLPPNLRLSDLNTALVANYAPMLHPFVLTAKALPIGDGPKNFCAKKTVTFWFECAVIDRFWLGHFTMRPRQNLLWRSQANPNRIKI